MTRKEWIVVIVAIGLGVVWQIPRHDEGMSPIHDAHGSARSGGPGSPGGDTDGDDTVIQGPYRTITLKVSGMT